MRKSMPWLLLVLVLLAGGTAYWLHGNLDRMVRQAIVEQGSELLGAPVRLDAVHIRPADGAGELLGLVIGNPPGFKSPHALEVQRVTLQLDMASLAQRVVVIRRIEVVGPDLIYEKGEHRTNFDALLANARSRPGTSARAGEPPDGAAKKFIVELFSVRDARAQASASIVNGATVSLTLPPIDRRDLGRAQGGLSPAQLGQVLGQAVQGQLVAALSPGRLLKPTAEGLEKAGQAVKGLFN